MQGRSGLLMATVLAHLIASAPGLHAQNKSTGATRLFAESPSVWFEAFNPGADVSRDGRMAIYGNRLIDLASGRVVPEASWPAFTPRRRVPVFGPHGEHMVFGTSAGKTGWYTMDHDHLTMLSIPPDASPQWSRDGRRLAYSRSSVPDSVFVSVVDGERAYHVSGDVTGMAWLPDGASLVVLTLAPNGISALSRLSSTTGRRAVVARDLDAPSLSGSPVAMSPDGMHVYVALAGSGAPRNETRHLPHARRQLGIYEIALADGTRRLVVPPPDSGDAFAPVVASGSLYWTRAESHSSVVVISANGGPAKTVVRDAMVPSWRPDGRQIGFTYGDWRSVDWAINWDGGVVDVDRNGAPTGPLQPFITGFHEDFQPVWSPRGRWIAFHSHRASTVVANYLSKGSTDDIWLRRVGAPARDPSEIRLTDFGWETGSPDWSRDGRRLAFVSFDRKGEPGINVVFVVAIDTTTGRAIDTRRLPLPAQIHNARWAAWSPVRDEIAIEADMGAGHQAIWITAADGTNARKVTEYVLQTYGGVGWMPDGKALVYAAESGGTMQLFTIPTNGGAPRQLTHDAANIFTPSVSPNGQLIAATRLLHTKEIWRMPLPR